MIKDKNTIINEIVDNASIILEHKKIFNEIIIDQLIKKQNTSNQCTNTKTINILKKDNIKIDNSIKLMRKNSGCWA